MAWAFTKTRRITKRRHSEDAQAILDRLAAYLHDSESEPVEMLCGFWKDQQDAITYQEMRTLVLEGYVDEVTARLWQQDYADLVKNRMPQIWNGAMIAGSRSQPLLTSLPNFTFNLQTPGVIRWIQSRGAEMVTVSTQRQKDAIALLLEDKMRNSHTVDELARLIRPCVGLYRQQAAAVSNFYDHMVKTLTEQHPRTKPERIQLKALDKATKYAERLHRQRAVTIAQTEMAFAYNYGADEGIRQAQADFLIGRCEKIWSTSGDDRVCPDCAALDGQRIGMEDTFFSGNRVVYDENGLYPPRHPRCACAVQYVEIEPPPFSQKTLDNQAQSDILREINQKPDGSYFLSRHEITEEDIQAVPAVTPHGWNETQATQLQEAHKALLRIASGQPVETEVAAVYTLDMAQLGEVVGEEDKVAIPDYLVPHIVTHNHPDCLIFSPSDIRQFILRDATVIATAVGNNGTVYLMQKLDSYSAPDFEFQFGKLKETLREILNEGNPQKYADTIRTFLMGAEKHGVHFITGTAQAL